MKDIENHTITGVLQNDLINILKERGILKEIENSRKNCFFCNKSIAVDDIVAIFIKDGNIELCCKEDACIEKLKEV